MQNRKHDYESIKALLEQPGGQETFRVPEGYFKQLHDSISARIDLEEGTHRNPTELFRVPEGYFVQLPAAVSKRIDHPEARVVPFVTVALRAAVAIAAVVAFSILLNRSTVQDEPPGNLLGGIDAQELQDSYLWEDIDEHALAEALPLSQQTEENTLQDYLIDSNADLSLIDIEL